MCVHVYIIVFICTNVFICVRICAFYSVCVTKCYSVYKICVICTLCVCYSVCYMCNLFVLSVRYVCVSGNRKSSQVTQLPGLELNNSQLFNDISL